MKTVAVIVLSVSLFAGGPAGAGAAAYAKLVDLDDKSAGRVRLMSVSHGVLIEIEVHGLAPGAHAISVHATGTCDASRQFATAGPSFSFDPARPHGFLAKGGPRAGDLPNQYAGADGNLHAAMVTTAFTLGNGVKSIFDRDGAAIIVHAGADDYLTQPDGRAGARLLCGTIIRTGEAGTHRTHR
jgi:superoxide dismutase, Cu-Zn family